MTLTTLRRKRLSLRRRDLEALEALYHSGILAAGHLVRLFWGGRSYGYLRLRMLADAGYVETTAFHEALPGRKRKKRKLTSFYLISRKGTDAIAHLLKEPPRPPWKNVPPSGRYYEFWNMGELWCRLLEDGIIEKPQGWISSRPAKKILGLAAYAPVHCIVVVQNMAAGLKKEVVALYYLRQDVPKKRINMLKNFLPRVDAAGVRKHFIICADLKVLRQTLSAFTNEFPERNIFVLTWESAIGALAGYLNNENKYYDELARRLEPQYGKINILPAGPLEAAPYMFFIRNGQQIHLAELISGHLATIAALQLKSVVSRTPQLLYAYIPNANYFHAVKSLLPANSKWLRLVIRDRDIGDDIFKVDA